MQVVINNGIFVDIVRAMGTKITFSNSLLKTDPQRNPVLIIGQVKHLTQLKYANVKNKLEPRVDEEVNYC